MPRTPRKQEFIKVTGDKALKASFAELPAVSRARVLEPAIKKATRPIEAEIIALTPIQLPPYSGQSPDVRLREVRLDIVKRKRTKGRSKKRQKWVGWFVQFPERYRLDIDPSDEHYYPAALEYGHGEVPPVGMMRKAAARSQGKATEIIVREMKANIANEFKRLFAKQKAKG